MGDTILKPDILALFSVFLVPVLFYIYYYTWKQKLVLKWIVRPLIPSGSEESLEFLSAKLTGIFFTGLVPFIIFVLIINISPARIGLVPGHSLSFWYLILILMLITGIISFFFSKDPKVREISPDLKIKDWYPGHLILSIVAWIVYISGYELFFRGIVWFLCIEAFGFWPALLINLLLYSLVHLPQGKSMALGAVPTGIVLCLLSNLTGSFLPAFMIHSSIAVMTQLFSLYHNPEVNLHFKKPVL